MDDCDFRPFFVVTVIGVLRMCVYDVVVVVVVSFIYLSIYHFSLFFFHIDLLLNGGL